MTAYYQVVTVYDLIVANIAQNALDLVAVMTLNRSYLLAGIVDQPTGDLLTARVNHLDKITCLEAALNLYHPHRQQAGAVLVA